MKENVGPV